MSGDDTADDGRTSTGRLGNWSRRSFLATGAAVGAAGAVSSETAEAGPGSAPRGGSRRGRGPPEKADLLLVDGEIHTMDDEDSIVSSVAIKGDEFLAVGDAERHRGPETTVVNLRGRTVTPGIIDNHNHIVLLGLRPGYHTPLENATSIKEVQATLAGRRPDVPPGRFITSIGGFDPIQFDEGRLPTRSELDAAVDDRPVYLQVAFLGPATTNSPGKTFFEGEGIPVGDDGSIAAGSLFGGGGPTGEALLALRERQTFEDLLRSTRDAMAYSTSVGVTTHLDEGAFAATGTADDGAAHAHPFEMYHPFLTLHRNEELSVRLQVNFLNLETDSEVPRLRDRLNHSFRLFGDDMMNTGGIGEFTAGTLAGRFDGEPSQAWKNGTELVARRGWRNENHSLVNPELQAIVDYWEEVDEDHDLSGLRWVLSHANTITEPYVDKLKALDAGLSLTGFRYLDGAGSGGGPPFRMIVDNGINVGMSSDAAQIAPLNPWLHMYYATTGRNANGDRVNGGQTITRREVLRLYTSANSWFLHDDRLGSIEPGHHADLVVLNRDYFSVPEEAIKDVRSVLTVVDGAVVHDAGLL